MSNNFLVITSSLNPESNSRLLAKQAFEFLKKHGGSEYLDLRDYPLPLCDGDKAYGDKNVLEVKRKIAAAQCIIVATPIYNFDVNAALKNLIEMTGDAWEDKIVGFLCAAGGKSSYMSVMSVANSLMLDFRSLIIPRFVYAEGSDFNGDEIDDKIKDRIDELVKQAARLTKATLVAN